MGNQDHSIFEIGVFSDNTLVGIVHGKLSRAHALKMNDGFRFNLDDCVTSPETGRHIFAAATNLTLQKGALAFGWSYSADESSPSYEDFGYETVGYCIHLRPEQSEEGTK